MGREHLTRGDLTELATDVGPAPMNVVGVLVLDATRGIDAGRVASVLRDRASLVPRLGQRLLAPRGARPCWVDDDLDAHHHVVTAACPAPGDGDALLDLAARVLVTPLPRDRPLWRVHVTPLADGGVGVVVVLHHVVADGLAGLALLSRLADPPGDVGIRSAPSRAGTVASTGRRGPVASAPAPRLLARRPWAPRTSLNAPTGARRSIRTAVADLEAVRRTAHRHGGSVNDVLLVATTGALARALDDRGEHPGHLVVSVPVARRHADAAGRLGNAVGVMPVRVPLTGSAGDRLVAVARTTSTRKHRTGGPSVPLLDLGFRGLAAASLFRGLVEHQRLVNTFLSNLRGPDTSLTLAGARIRRLVPVTTTAGNVSVAFAALSYAGTLEVTVVTDPDVAGPADALAAHLQACLHGLCADGQEQPGEVALRTAHAGTRRRTGDTRPHRRAYLS